MADTVTRYFEGNLNLTDASLIAPHLTPRNAGELIGAACSMKKRELKKYLAGIAPKEQFEPSIRTLPSKGSPKEKASSVPETKEPPPIFEPATEKRYNIRFSAGEGFTGKLHRLAEVLGIECAQKHMEQILEKALEVALDKKDPRHALERRRKREERKKVKQAKTRPSEESGNTASPPDNTKEKKVQHNDQPAAESFYGQSFMEQKIQARREAQHMKCAASNAG